MREDKEAYVIALFYKIGIDHKLSARIFREITYKAAKNDPALEKLFPHHNTYHDSRDLEAILVNLKISNALILGPDSCYVVSPHLGGDWGKTSYDSLLDEERIVIDKWAKDLIDANRHLN